MVTVSGFLPECSSSPFAFHIVTPSWHAICTVSEWNCERKCFYRVLQCCTIMPSDPPTYAMHPEQKPGCQSFFCLSCIVVVKRIYPRENIECFQWQSSTKKESCHSLNLTAVALIVVLQTAATVITLINSTCRIIYFLQPYHCTAISFTSELEFPVLFSQVVICLIESKASVALQNR